MAGCPKLGTEEALTAFWVGDLWPGHCLCISVSRSHFMCVCTHCVSVISAPPNLVQESAREVPIFPLFTNGKARQM